MSEGMLRIGIDVGGTNTDAVLLRAESNGQATILKSAKCPTTGDVTSGVREALRSVLPGDDGGASAVQLVSIGTTHLINALLQRRGLARTSIVRLGRPSTAAVPPFSDWPNALRSAVRCRCLLANGGYNFDGAEAISEPSESQVKEFAAAARAQDSCRHFVVCGVFSPVRSDQELQASRWIVEAVPDASVTLSHEVGQLGFLERENAALLNECLKPNCARAVGAFQEAVRSAGLACPLLLTLSDGTVASAPDCLSRPVALIGSGPTNSMRGAAFLTGLSDAIVADIGGTTTDVGLLVGGFPKPAAARVRVGGVVTNFSLPDVASVALGGGSIITPAPQSEAAARVGPNSVGYRLPEAALVFGGQTPTLTDAAVGCAGVDGIGDADCLRHRLAEDGGLERLLRAAQSTALKLLETVVEAARVSKSELPVVLVGGGATLFSGLRTLAGLQVRVPPNSGVVNAVGAALCQVGGCVDTTINLAIEMERQHRLEAVKTAAIDAAVARGAARGTTRVTELHEIQLPYIPGGTCRVIVRAIGEIDLMSAARLNDTAIGAADRYDAGAVAELDTEPSPETSAGTAAASENDAAPIPAPVPRHFDAEDGSWQVSEYDVHCLSVGAGLLGCGGGGSPYVGRLMLQEMLASGLRPRIIPLDRLLPRAGPDALAVLPAFMGSPTILVEKLPSGVETAAAVDLVGRAGDLRREAPDKRLHMVDEPHAGGASGGSLVGRVACLAGAEIGGMNSLEPLVTAARTGLPVLDADGMGRAFPELQMFLPHIGNCPPAPAAVADEFGRGAVIVECYSSKELEARFRELCASRGCSLGVVLCPLTLRQCREHLLLGSYTRAWRLGDRVLRARLVKDNPAEEARQLLSGRVLVPSGKIADVQRVTGGGFARGNLVVAADDGGSLEVVFQNEYLVARRPGASEQEAEACTPDLIIVMDADTGEPVATEDLRYGLRVSVLAAPCHPRMATEAALAVVGPGAFGFAELKYRPCGEYPLESETLE